MDVHKILAELRAERDQLGEAILALERVGAAKGSKRRGRPPKWMTEMKQSGNVQPKKRGRPKKAASAA
jgi:AT hook motif